jgi:hypothetical protein
MIQAYWNKTVNKTYPPKLRDYITFSDLGKSYLDRYYKMNAEPITNEFDDRTLRIFDAGRVMEFIVLRALTMAGILNQKQEYVEIPATSSQLKVMGYLDCTIGGFTDWDKAKEIITRHLAEYKLNLDDQLLEQKAINIIEGLREQYPKGIEEEILVEVKSINSMAFWAHKNRDEQGNFLGYDHNKLQLYGYMKAKNLKKGILLYISKDDFVIEEINLVLGDEKMEKLFNEDVATMTKYYKNKEIPPKEEDVVWNDQKKQYEVNWRIERSPYLTKITTLAKEVWLEVTEDKVRELNLEQKWRDQAKEHGFDVTGLTTEQIKKMCMARNREINKMKLEKEGGKSDATSKL